MGFSQTRTIPTKIALVGVAAMSLIPSAMSVAQTVTDSQKIANQSFENAAISDLEVALIALRGGDYQKASTYLQFASAQTNRLKLRAIATKFASTDEEVNYDNIKYSIADSAVLNFDNFASLDNAFETRRTDAKGRTVTVRVLSNGTALDSFMKLSEDQAQLEKANLEAVMMAGEPAIKKRKEDGSLSVVIMSEADHALIEIDGQDEDSVMALIETHEESVKNK